MVTSLLVAVLTAGVGLADDPPRVDDPPHADDSPHTADGPRAEEIPHAADTPRAASLGIAGFTREQVAHRRAELMAARPRLARPVVLTASGAGGVLLGIGGLWAGFIFGYWYAFTEAALGVALVVVGAVVFAAGVAVLVVGVVTLVRAMRARRPINAELEELQLREEALDAETPIATTQGGPQPTLVLARW